jgi:GxxExxY protein
MHDDEIDELTERVIGAAIAVHSALGPGLLESVYRDCLAIELRHQNIPFELEVRFPIVYRGVRVRNSLRLDVLVDGRLVVEIKVVERLHFVYKAPTIREGLQRVDRPDIYARKRAARQAQSRI